MNFFRRLFGKDSSSKDFQGTDNIKSISVDGTKFRLVNSVDELCAAIEAEGQGVLRFRSVAYGEVLSELTQKLEKQYGRTSPQYRDSVPSILICAGCLWEFPGSYKLKLQAPEMFGGMAIGATPGFKQFGETGVCPQCGSNESLFVYESFQAEQIDEADIRAIQKYWQECARKWWNDQQRSEGFCDRCNTTINRGQGYLSGTNLICDNCLHKGLLTEGLEKLKENPHYYGAAILRKARLFRR